MTTTTTMTPPASKEYERKNPAKWICSQKSSWISSNYINEKLLSSNNFDGKKKLKPFYWHRQPNNNSLDDDLFLDGEWMIFTIQNFHKCQYTLTTTKNSRKYRSPQFDHTRKTATQSNQKLLSASININIVHVNSISIHVNLLTVSLTRFFFSAAVDFDKNSIP